MRIYRFLLALPVAMALGGCAVPPAPVDPAFQRLSVRVRALVRRDFPEAKVVAHPNFVATSYRMAPPTLETNGNVYVRTFSVQETGLSLEMYPTEAWVLEMPPPHPEPYEHYRRTGYTGYAWLNGTRQAVYVYFQAGSRTPARFSRAMKALIRESTTPYHQPKNELSASRHE